MAGILLELVSELQRKRFKDDPANKGKPYAGGLFSLARSINYGGYTLWRGGYVSQYGVQSTPGANAKAGSGSWWSCVGNLGWVPSGL